MNRKISTTVYLTEEQLKNLKELSEDTGVPIAVFVRRGVDKVIKEWEGNDEQSNEHSVDKQEGL